MIAALFTAADAAAAQTATLGIPVLPSDPNPILAFVLIVLATFVHEDLATVAAGIAVSDGDVGFWVALPALYTGIVAGDIGLYWAGRFIATNRRARKAAGTRRFGAWKGWLDQRLVAGVILVRFMPGFRLPAYTTYGFFAMPFRRFALSVMAAASVWTTGLFSLSYAFGAETAHLLGWLRWPVIIVAVLVPLLVVRRMLHGSIPAEMPGAAPDGAAEELGAPARVERTGTGR